MHFFGKFGENNKGEEGEYEVLPPESFTSFSF